MFCIVENNIQIVDNDSHLLPLSHGNVFIIFLIFFSYFFIIKIDKMLTENKRTRGFVENAYYSSSHLHIIVSYFSTYSIFYNIRV